VDHVEGSWSWHLSEAAHLLLHLCMLVEDSHNGFHLFASLQVVFNLDEVLDELNVGLVEETEEFSFEVGRVKDSDV